MSTRRLVVIGVLVALLLAGVASFYASRQPDGLAAVAKRAGFSHTEKESAASDSPLAGYSTRGVDDDRIGGGVAGVAGSLVVLLLAGGLAYAVRRRRPTEDHD